MWGQQGVRGQGACEPAGLRWNAGRGHRAGLAVYSMSWRGLLVEPLVCERYH